jgi:hypothetical protein
MKDSIFLVVASILSLLTALFSYGSNDFYIYVGLGIFLLCINMIIERLDKLIKQNED